MQAYKPISCDFYDEIINTITLNQQITLTYKMSDTSFAVVGKITDVFTRNKEEFCVINGTEIRLDHITTIHPNSI